MPGMHDFPNIRLIGLILLASILQATQAHQEPLALPSSGDSDFYRFQWPIRKVAIIGAGPGGLVSYREFVRAGFEVRLFERDSMPGGNWHYTEEIPLDAPIPNANVAIADFEPCLPPQNATFPYEKHYSGAEANELLRAHRAPKPIWASLRSNGPAPATQIPELPWPKDTPWQLTQQQLQRYVRAFASYHNLNSNDNNSNISYNTRVELVQKRFGQGGHPEGWRLTLKKLKRTGSDSAAALWTQEDFDAVVVASGRYNAPNIPHIKGLDAWAKKFSRHLIHSRQYRRPEHYTNQTVLVIGAAMSGEEISRDLTSHAREVLTSVRPINASNPEAALRRLFLRRVPANVTIIGEIKEFLAPAEDITSSGFLLTNGTVITGVDAIIFATGYRYTFPFLPQFHGLAEDRNPSPLITDGSHIRGLYRDIFSIEEPTLGFINMNMGIQTFYLPEYFAVALSKVWSGKAKLPSTRRMWRWCEERVREKGGYNKYYQFIGLEKMADLIRFLVGWLNEAAVEYGGRQLDGLDPSYQQIRYYWNKARFAIDDRDLSPHKPSSFSTQDTEETSLLEFSFLYSDYF